MTIIQKMLLDAHIVLELHISKCAFGDERHKNLYRARQFVQSKLQHRCLTAQTAIAIIVDELSPHQEDEPCIQVHHVSKEKLEELSFRNAQKRSKQQ